MNLTMKKFASSLLLALTLTTPLVMSAVQAKTTAPQLKVSQAATTAPAPTQTKPPTKTPENKSKKSTTAQVNINSSTEKELQQVKGIGAKTAKKIVAGRPYKSLDELTTKKVMSAKELETLKAQLAL
jgi:competence protein ComEA